MSNFVLDTLKRMRLRIGRKSAWSLEGIDFVVLGLGNPGSEYVETRHNAGANAVRRFVRDSHGRLEKVGGHLRAALVRLEVPDESDSTDTVTVLAGIPLTFMNESGVVASWILHRSCLPPHELLVVHDDLDLPLGTVKLKLGGGSAGHRGVDSVIKALGTNGFQRLRIGIGRPPEGTDAVDYVLSPFSPDEESSAQEAIARASEAITVTATRGIEVAMNLYNIDGTTGRKRSV